MYSKIQYISQGRSATEQLHNIQCALDAGCTWIQLRFKDATIVELTTIAEQVQKLCSGYEATFILNDHVNLAKQLDTDGVHVGLQDMPVTEARKILGDKKIIGATANTLQHVIQRIDENCNYIGLGPLRFTTTKENLSPVLGFTGYHTILNALKREETTIPVYAIGGIIPEDINELISCGVYGIAVSGILTHAAEKRQLIKKLKFSLYAPTDYCQHKI